MSDQLKQELKQLISEVIEIDDFYDHDDFIRDLGVDSMMSIELVARIEKKYRITIAESYLPEMKTFNDVYRIATEILQEQKAKA